MNNRVIYAIFLLSACGPRPDHKADCGAQFDCGDGIEDGDGDGYCSDRDCNDNSCDVYPGADEICDGLDNDCNGLIDGQDSRLKAEADEMVDIYVDNDGDLECGTTPLYSECWTDVEGLSYGSVIEYDEENYVFCTTSMNLDYCYPPYNDGCDPPCLLDCCDDGTESECAGAPDPSKVYSECDEDRNPECVVESRN